MPSKKTNETANMNLAQRFPLHVACKLGQAWFFKSVYSVFAVPGEENKGHESGQNLWTSIFSQEVLTRFRMTCKQLDGKIPIRTQERQPRQHGWTGWPSQRMAWLMAVVSHQGRGNQR